jgi:hypothetical protein
MNTGIAFFDNFSKENITIEASSNGPAANYLLDHDPRYGWDGINDGDEYVRLKFPTETSLNTILILNHRLKGFTVEGLPDDHIVHGWNNNLLDINAVPEYSHSILRFKTVSIRELTLSIRKTDEGVGHIGSFLPLNQIGQFQGFPKLSVRYTSTVSKIQTMDRKYHLNRKNGIFESVLTFQNYPKEYEQDLLLARKIAELEKFFIYPCGGYIGQDHFLMESEGYRPTDIHKVSVSSDLTSSYSKNIYVGTQNLSYSMVEVN